MRRLAARASAQRNRHVKHHPRASSLSLILGYPHSPRRENERERKGERERKRERNESSEIFDISGVTAEPFSVPARYLVAIAGRLVDGLRTSFFVVRNGIRSPIIVDHAVASSFKFISAFANVFFYGIQCYIEKSYRVDIIAFFFM